MKRARAAQLILVNWNGVFYERYELNESVTALEGANGAGKTTVLIAAFIALLPDMKHLRFTNVGEHPGSAGDRGIWGASERREDRPTRCSTSSLRAANGSSPECISNADPNPPSNQVRS